MFDSLNTQERDNGVGQQPENVDTNSESGKSCQRWRLEEKSSDVGRSVSLCQLGVAGPLGFRQRKISEITCFSKTTFLIIYYYVII